LSLEDNKNNIIENLNDYLVDCFNTNKTFNLEQINLMLDNSNKYFAKAYLLGAMIDIIQSYGINPVKHIDISVVFFYWYQIRLLRYNETKAVDKFIKEFELDNSIKLDIHKPLVELVTRKVSDKYIGIIR
jgi:hypothetical protein